YRVNGFPSPTTAGVAGYFVVTALDFYGNTEVNTTRTLAFSSTDSQAVLPANYTLTTGLSGDNGVHVFSATLKTAGSRSLTATATANGTITGSQTGITVNAAAAARLTISAPLSVSAGMPFTITVTALDAFGNAAKGYLGAVAFTSSDPRAALPPNYTFTSADAGVHTFTVTLNSGGTQSLTVADTIAPSINDTDSGITVAATSSDELFPDRLIAHPEARTVPT